MELNCELYECPECHDSEYEPRYEALSYTWGSTEHLETVYVCGSQTATKSHETLRITPNLASALRHLRYVNRPQTLWIDAICINQQNELERNEQMKRMGSIYTLANRVVLWLGPEEEDSNHALSTLNYLGKQIEFSVGLRHRSPDATEPHWFHGAWDLPYDGRTWSAVTSLLRRSWFSRLWVLQEVQLANQQTVAQCGNDIISWYLLRRAILALDGRRALPEELAGPLAQARSAARPKTQLSLP